MTIDALKVAQNLSLCARVSDNLQIALKRQENVVVER